LTPDRKPCSWKGIMVEYQDHYNEHFTPKKRICEYCEAEFDSLSLLEEHLDEKNGTCEEQPIQCPYADVSCVAGMRLAEVNVIENLNMLHLSRTLKRKNLEDHLVKNQAYHLDLVYKNITSRLDKLESLECRSSAESLEIIHPLNNRKPHLNSQASTDDYGYSGSINSQTNIDFDSGLLFYESKIEPKLGEINSKLEMVQVNQENLVGDFGRLYQSNEMIRQENVEFRDIIKEYKSLCTDLHRALALSQISVMALEERIIDLEKTSYDGTILI